MLINFRYRIILLTNFGLNFIVVNPLCFVSCWFCHGNRFAFSTEHDNFCNYEFYCRPFQLNWDLSF